MIWTPNLEKYKFLDDNEKYISRLPEYEQHLVEYFMRRITQKDIARLLKCTQGAISGRIRKVIRRIEFLKTLEKYNIKKIIQDLKPFCGNLAEEGADRDQLIIETLIRTTSQTDTANIVNRIQGLEGPEKMTQVKVRHRYERCLIRLRRLKEGIPSGTRFKYAKHLNLLELVKKSLYSLNEVKLPQFDRSLYL